VFFLLVNIPRVDSVDMPGVGKGMPDVCYA